MTKMSTDRNGQTKKSCDWNGPDQKLRRSEDKKIDFDETVFLYIPLNFVKILLKIYFSTKIRCFKFNKFGTT